MTHMSEELGTSCDLTAFNISIINNDLSNDFYIDPKKNLENKDKEISINITDSFKEYKDNQEDENSTDIHKDINIKDLIESKNPQVIDGLNTDDEFIDIDINNKKLLENLVYKKIFSKVR